MDDFPGLVVFLSGSFCGGDGDCGGAFFGCTGGGFTVPGDGLAAICPAGGSGTSAAAVIVTGVPQPGHFKVCPTSASGPLSLALHFGQSVAIGMTTSRHQGLNNALGLPWKLFYRRRKSRSKHHPVAFRLFHSASPN